MSDDIGLWTLQAKGSDIIEDIPPDDVKITPVPRKGQTVSGYGGRMPTRFMVRFRHRWHRVYVMSWGNAGTGYILARGHTWYVERY